MKDPLDLDAIEKLLAAATPAPWCWSGSSDKGNGYVVGTAIDERTEQPIAGRFEMGEYMDEEILCRDVVGDYEAATVNYNNAEAIVALRNSAPALLVEVRALRRVAAAAKAYRDGGASSPTDEEDRALDAALKEAGL